MASKEAKALKRNYKAILSPEAKKAQRKEFSKKFVVDLFMQIGIWFFLIFAWLSMYLLVIKSIKSIPQDQKWPFEPTWIQWGTAFGNYKEALRLITRYIFNSFVITLIQTAGMLIVPILTAFAFVRFRFPGKNFIFMLFLALMMIPGTLTLTSQYIIVVKYLPLMNNIFGVILPGIAGSIPMSVFLLRSFFGGVSQEMFEAAEIDGAGDFTVLLRIMVPLSLPIIAVLGVQDFMGSWNDYLWPSLVLFDTNRTISVALISFTDQYYAQYGAYSVPFAGYVLSALPIIVLFIFCSKQFVEGISAGAFKM